MVFFQNKHFFALFFPLMKMIEKMNRQNQGRGRTLLRFLILKRKRRLRLSFSSFPLQKKKSRQRIQNSEQTFVNPHWFCLFVNLFAWVYSTLPEMPFFFRKKYLQNEQHNQKILKVFQKMLILWKFSYFLYLQLSLHLIFSKITNCKITWTK
jgi:hypothetical protein